MVIVARSALSTAIRCAPPARRALRPGGLHWRPGLHGRRHGDARSRRPVRSRRQCGRAEVDRVRKAGRMADGNILALDLGSSSVRTLVLDGDTLDAVPDALARRDVRLLQSPDGAAELDPDDYVEAVISCLDELTAAGVLDGVSTVAISAQWHSLAGLDAYGRPVGPGLSWLDTRAVRSGPGPADSDAFHVRTGAWWHPLYW